MKRLLLFLWLVSAIHAAVIPAASPSRNDVWTALQLASAGDTVTIPAGSSNWTTGIEWTAPENVTVIGAGTSATGGGDQTVITDNIAANEAIFRITIPSSGLFRLSGITVQSGTGALKDGGTIAIGGPGSGATASIRIDHCHLLMSSANNYKSLLLGDGVRGVLDSSILDLSGTNAIYAYNGRSGSGESQGNYEWTQPTAFGTSDFFYIEDCIINGDVGSGAYSTRVWDGFTAAKMVVRFNTLSQSCINETHDTGHAPDDRGTRASEAYGNLVTSSLVFEPNFNAIMVGNGVNLTWGNSWDQVYKNIYFLKIQRTGSITVVQTPTPEGWGYVGPSPISTGTVDVTGTDATKTGGPDFDVTWPAGTMIYIVDAVGEGIAGQIPADGPSLSISSVNSTTSITLANGGQLGAPLSGKAYTVGSGWDGNTNAYGYPALDQPGRGNGDLLSGNFPSKVNSTTGTVAWPNQAFEPMYFWNNVGDFVPGWSGMVVLNRAGEDLIQSDRDYYLPASGIQTSPSSPFDGTSGVGWGTLANRPATCTTGVAYFATDQGSWNTSSSNPHGVQQNGSDGVLYVATSTDTWTLYYTPYTYPHPLRNEGVTADLTVSGTTTVTGTITLP